MAGPAQPDPLFNALRKSDFGLFRSWRSVQIRRLAIRPCGWRPARTATTIIVTFLVPLCVPKISSECDAALESPKLAG